MAMLVHRRLIMCIAQKDHPPRCISMKFPGERLPRPRHVKKIEGAPPNILGGGDVEGSGKPNNKPKNKPTK